MSLRDLKYKFIPIESYEYGYDDENYTSYKELYPHAPVSVDGKEALICGEGDLSEEQMNEYKSSSESWNFTNEEVEV